VGEQVFKVLYQGLIGDRNDGQDGYKTAAANNYGYATTQGERFA
jgi:hypothetical protein